MKLKDCSLKPLVYHHQDQHPIDWDGCFRRRAPLELEIGFGLGEFLLRQAKEDSQRNYIGIEQHWERISKTLRRMGETSQNIRILRIDARVALERLFPPKSIDRIHCLFPCPWPKKGHVKHRLFARAFLKTMNSRLKDGGQVRIVTDYYPYYRWVLEQVDERDYTVETGTVGTRYGTKYERKWADEGQKKFFEILLHKKEHVQVPVKEDVALKTYKLKNFDYGKFSFCESKGEVNVILKDSLYDPVKKKAMFHVVVAEKDLTQHVWISVYYARREWHVAAAKGQNFFPTPGVTKALEILYNAAKQTA